MVDSLHQPFSLQAPKSQTKFHSAHRFNPGMELAFKHQIMVMLYKIRKMDLQIILLQAYYLQKWQTGLNSQTSILNWSIILKLAIRKEIVMQIDHWLLAKFCKVLSLNLHLNKYSWTKISLYNPIMVINIKIMMNNRYGRLLKT